MKHRVVHIKDWQVDVFIEDGYHPDEVMECLEEMGASNGILERAYGLVTENRPNQAFTFSVFRHTCIYIGWTASGAEFVNSLVHEIRHLVDHIADAYGLGTNNEKVGYLSGDAALLLAEDICEMGCGHCRKN